MGPVLREGAVRRKEWAECGGKAIGGPSSASQASGSRATALTIDSGLDQRNSDSGKLGPAVRERQRTECLTGRIPGLGEHQGTGKCELGTEGIVRFTSDATNRYASVT